MEKADLERQIADLRAEITILTVRLEESGATDRALLGKVSSSPTIPRAGLNNALDFQLGEAEAELQRQRGLINDLEAAKSSLTNELDDAKGQIVQSRADGQSLVAQLAQSQTRATGLETDKSTLITEVSDLSRKLSTLEETYTLLVRERDNIASDLEGTKNRLKQAESNVRHLSTQMAETLPT